MDDKQYILDVFRVLEYQEDVSRASTAFACSGFFRAIDIAAMFCFRKAAQLALEAGDFAQVDKSTDELAHILHKCGLPYEECYVR